MVPTVANSSPAAWAWAASTAAGERSRSAATSPGSTPAHRAKHSVTRAARSRSSRRSVAPLCTMARWNSPVAAGMDSSDSTLPPPADSPNTVTRSGSPPKLGDVVLHPLEGGDLVEQADVGAGARVVDDHEAEGAEAVVEGDHDRVGGGGQPGAVVHAERAGAELERAAVDPHQHRPAGVVGGGGPDVEREAVVALVVAAHARHQAVERAAGGLPRGRSRTGGVEDALPDGRRWRAGPIGARRREGRHRARRGTRSTRPRSPPGSRPAWSTRWSWPQATTSGPDAGARRATRPGA